MCLLYVYILISYLLLLHCIGTLSYYSDHSDTPPFGSGHKGWELWPFDAFICVCMLVLSICIVWCTCYTACQYICLYCILYKYDMIRNTRLHYVLYIPYIPMHFTVYILYTSFTIYTYTPYPIYSTMSLRDFSVRLSHTPGEQSMVILEATVSIRIHV